MLVDCVENCEVFDFQIDPTVCHPACNLVTASLDSRTAHLVSKADAVRALQDGSTSRSRAELVFPFYSRLGRDAYPLGFLPLLDSWYLGHTRLFSPLLLDFRDHDL